MAGREGAEHRAPVLFCFPSIDTLERWYGFALVFIERVRNYAPVFDVDIWRSSVVLPRQCVFHPILVITLCTATSDLRVSERIHTTAYFGVVLPGMGST